MSNPIFNDISIPCFDLTWLQLQHHTKKNKEEEEVKEDKEDKKEEKEEKEGEVKEEKKEGDKEEGEDGAVGDERRSSSYAFVAGGGGNKTKSGVLNKIVVFKFVGDAGVEQVAAIDCHHGLCENLCTTTISKRVVIGAAFQEKCALLEVYLDKDDKVVSKELASFGTEELSEEDMSINASCFVHVKAKNGGQDEVFLVTGGENGVAHVWQVSEKSGKWSVSKVKEFSHHKGPIKSIRAHPSKSWICSGGEDGVCRIVDIDSLTLLSTVNCTSDGVGSGGKVPHCRACSFSNDGEHLFTIQSGRMGDAHIVMWDIVVEEDESNETNSKKSKKNNASAKTVPTLTVSPNKVVRASKFPITRLSMNSEDESFAVGDCSGAITIFNASSLSKTNHYQCHDFPVTGLGFAPRAILSENDCTKNAGVNDILFSCSADNKLTTILVKDSNAMMYLLFFLLIVLLFGVYFTR